MTSRVQDQQFDAGSGRPRLVVGSHGNALLGSAEADGGERVHLLGTGCVTIGGDDSQDVRLPGLAPSHGEIRYRSEGDEYVYSHLVRGGSSHVDGARVLTAELHNGSRLDLDGWTLVFQREEFADHGRYDGGRQGGGYAGGGMSHSGGDAGEHGRPGQLNPPGRTQTAPSRTAEVEPPR